MRTLIGINTLTAVDSQVYSNHCQFWFRLAKQFPDDTFALFTPARASIDRMRNISARVALENDYDYLMFIDDDVFVPFDAYKKLRAMNYDIAAGNVVVRGYPFNPMMFKYNEDKCLSFYTDYKGKDKDGILDVDAVGFSCCLIKVSLLKRVIQPYFVTGPFNTEDVYFCVKAKEAFPQVKMGVHVGVECGHLGYPPIYTPSNVHLFMDLEKPTTPVEEGRQDNREGYFDKCLDSFKE
jgi:hypothetical protein